MYWNWNLDLVLLLVFVVWLLTVLICWWLFGFCWMIGIWLFGVWFWLFVLVLVVWFTFLLDVRNCNFGFDFVLIDFWWCFIRGCFGLLVVCCFYDLLVGFWNCSFCCLGFWCLLFYWLLSYFMIVWLVWMSFRLGCGVYMLDWLVCCSFVYFAYFCLNLIIGFFIDWC